MTIYQNAFKNALSFLKVSQRRLASMLEVNVSQVLRIISDQRKPSLELVIKLETITGLSFGGLVVGDFEANHQHLYFNFSLFNQNKMIINYNEMSADDRSYLRRKFQVEVDELNESLKVARKRLNARFAKSNLKEGELEVLETALSKAQANLDFLIAGNASAEMIADQQVKVDEADSALSKKLEQSGILTDRQLALEQLEIEEIELRIKLRQDKITAIDAVG